MLLCIHTAACGLCEHHLNPHFVSSSNLGRPWHSINTQAEWYRSYISDERKPLTQEFVSMRWRARKKVLRVKMLLIKRLFRRLGVNRKTPLTAAVAVFDLFNLVSGQVSRMKQCQLDVPSDFCCLKPTFLWNQDNHPSNTEKVEPTWQQLGFWVSGFSALRATVTLFNCCDSKFWLLVNLGYTTRRVKNCVGVISRLPTALPSRSHQERLLRFYIFTESILSKVFFFWPSSQPGFASVSTMANYLLDIFSISRVILYLYSLLYPGEVSRQNRTVALPGSTMAGPPPLCRKCSDRKSCPLAARIAEENQGFQESHSCMVGSPFSGPHIERPKNIYTLRYI